MVNGPRLPEIFEAERLTRSQGMSQKDLELSELEHFENTRGAPSSVLFLSQVVSHDATTGLTFCAGGKWTTWREMAQDVVDRVTAERGLRASRCKTRDLGLLGRDGCVV